MVQTKETQAAPAPSVERRAEPRTMTAQPVLITVPHAHPMEAWLLDLASAGAKVRMPMAVEVGSKLKMEAKEVLLFANVVRCEPVRGAYEVAVSFSQPLELLVEMRRLNAALLGA